MDRRLFTACLSLTAQVTELAGLLITQRVIN